MRKTAEGRRERGARELDGMQLATLPLFERLASATTVLLAGAGGGFDVFAGLPVFFALRAKGVRVPVEASSGSIRSWRCISRSTSAAQRRGRRATRESAAGDAARERSWEQKGAERAALSAAGRE